MKNLGSGRNYTKFRKRMMNQMRYEEDRKPSIIVQPECKKCKRMLAEHPSYPRSSYPVYNEECPFQWVDT